MIAPFKWLTKSHIYEKYSKDPGNMLVHTGVIGWFLSSAAQIFAIAINDKISKKEKMFLIPQEFADAVVNCVSFYAVTNSMKSFGKKLTSSAKLRTPAITKLLEERGLVLKKGAERVKDKIYAGDWDFNITKLDDYKSAVENTYKPFNNGVEVITGLVGSILSSNLITPVFRNYYAAKKQKQFMTYSENNQKLPAPMSKLSFANYQKLAASKPYTGNLKV